MLGLFASRACKNQPPVIQEARVSVVVDLAWFNRACKPLLIDPQKITGKGLEASLAQFREQGEEASFARAFYNKKFHIIPSVAFYREDIQAGESSSFMAFRDKLDAVGFDVYPIRAYSNDSPQDFWDHYHETVASKIQTTLDAPENNFVVAFVGPKTLRKLNISQESAKKLYVFSSPDEEGWDDLTEKFNIKHVKSPDVFVYATFYRQTGTYNT